MRIRQESGWPERRGGGSGADRRDGAGVRRKDEDGPSTDVVPAPQLLDERTWAHLVVIVGAQLGQLYSLAPMTSGSSSAGSIRMDIDIGLLDGAVSRHHARVIRKGDQVRIQDLGGRNGHLCGGVRVVELANGDKIQLGGTTI